MMMMAPVSHTYDCFEYQIRHFRMTAFERSDVTVTSAAVNFLPPGATLRRKSVPKSGIKHEEETV
jgi:hypothetical protein